MRKMNAKKAAKQIEMGDDEPARAGAGPSPAPSPPRHREEADRAEEDWAALEDALFGADGEVAGGPLCRPRAGRTEPKDVDGPPSSAARRRASPPAAGPRNPRGGGLPGNQLTVAQFHCEISGAGDGTGGRCADRGKDVFRTLKP